jgi:hypothetical protein
MGPPVISDHYEADKKANELGYHFLQGMIEFMIEQSPFIANDRYFDLDHQQGYGNGKYGI